MKRFLLSVTELLLLVCAAHAQTLREVKANATTGALQWPAAADFKTANSIQGTLNAANPTGTVGLTAVNGAAGTYMRSDAAPPLDVGIAPTWTARHIFGVNGAASVPAISMTGVPFAGTGTTSFPLLYINETGATASTTLNTAGTLLGVNGNGTSDLINLLTDGVSQMRVSSVGMLTAASLRSGSLGNISSLNNSLVTLGNNGTTISRNIADANQALIVNQTHASSTGNIIEAQLAGTAVFTVGSAGKVTASANGAASTPALTLTGVPFAGDGTTSFPLLYINETGATASTTLSTAGTMLGINKNSATGDFVSFMVDGTPTFRVSNGGVVVASTGYFVNTNVSGTGFFPRVGE